MWYVFFSVICSVSVAVIIKLAKGRGYKYLHLIVWNYPVAALATYLLLMPQVGQVIWSELPWDLYLPLAVLLPTIFLCIAYAIQYSGIVKTEVAQRLSLFIPLLAAFFIFKEHIGTTKLIGIGVGILAILFSIGWNKKGQKVPTKAWGYPLAVFLGIGIIDILFKKVALYQGVPYSFSMFVVFVGAMVLSFLFLAYKLLKRHEQLKLGSLFWGILLGLFNFGNILFYMKAHRALPDSPSIVFTGMNIGVILLGAVIGVVFFKERLSFYNKIGIGLAMISVLIIAYL